jgi:hypothetical protein
MTTHRLRLNWRRLYLGLLVAGVVALASGLAIAPAQAQSIVPRRPALDHYYLTACGWGSAPLIQSSDPITYYIYLPIITKAESCPPIPGETYSVLSVNPPPTDRPAEIHADLNLSMRGYALTNAPKTLVDYNGSGYGNAPQLPGLFADNRTGVISDVYQVYDWDWSCNCRGALLANYPVTLAGLATTPGETIHVPDSGYAIGALANGYEVLVLYAALDRITLKYTRDDNVVYGYTLHVENVCVEPSLLALYQERNAAGRGTLPALHPGQAFGRAKGGAIGVAIRDNGTFMDPRSRKDWWRGR